MNELADDVGDSQKPESRSTGSKREPNNDFDYQVEILTQYNFILAYFVVVLF